MADSGSQLIAAVADKIPRRGPEERAWFESWRAAFGDVLTERDEEECGLLLDMLAAFDAWLQSGQSFPTSEPPQGAGARRPRTASQSA